MRTGRRHRPTTCSGSPLGMQHAEVAYAASTRHGRQDGIETLANNLPQEEQLDRAQRHHLFSTDIIVRGILDGQVTYIAVEASITGGEDDVRRADHRRQLVERITNVPCRSALVANSLAQRLATTVPDPDVEFPTVSADLFNSLPRGESTPDPTPIRQDVLVLPLAPRE